MSELSFGRRLLELTRVEEIRAAEHAEGRKSPFEAVAPVITSLVRRAFSAHERVARIREKPRINVLSVDAMDQSQRRVIEALYSPDQLQKRGMWSAPEKISLNVGRLTLPWHWRREARFAHNAASEERSSVASDSGAVVAVWAVLEPLFEALLRPLELRGPLSGTLERDDELASWEEVDTTMAALGLDLGDEMRPLRPGGGWSRFRGPDQLQLKHNLLSAIADRLPDDIADRFRMLRQRTLVERYYSRFKREPPKRKQVITRKLERDLIAFFGGDWLAFVGYLGELPHEDEHVVTAMPAPRLMVGAKARAAEIAVKKGLPIEAVEQMLAAYWQGSGGESPIHSRVQALEGYWQWLDHLHATQARESGSLWGLIDEAMLDFESPWLGEDRGHRSELYRHLLPGDLTRAIEDLWSATMLVRWPNRIVSEPFPHAAMATALGPALRFWHGVGLTAWFICEGPSSRTDLAGLAHYYRRDLAELDALATPVAAEFLAELRDAEARLGPLVDIVDSHTTSTGMFQIEMSTTLGVRRDGFEMLRDIVTRHRRAWSQHQFPRYLRARWEGELRRAAHQFQLMVEERGKPPTLKQFAKHAVGATNNWLGGDIRLFYSMISQRGPTDVEKRIVLPADRRGFARAVYAALGGRSPERGGMDQASREASAAAWQKHRHASHLARESLRYVQLQEAIGEPPELKQFGEPRFRDAAALLGDDLAAAWARYGTTIWNLLHAQ